LPRCWHWPWWGRGLRSPIEAIVTEITTPGDWDTIRDLLKTNWIAIAAPAFVSYSDGGTDVVYYDDYQDEAGEDPRGWYQIDADLHSRLSPPRAGRALVIGIDHGKPYPADHGVTFYEDLVGPDYRGGEHSDARISVEDLTARVTFTRRVFRDYEEDEDGFISIVAPIVEEH
jgi:hypothetical protein